MIRLLIITLLFINTYSRENPFFPSKGEKDLPSATNIDMSVSMLKRAAITLPSSARRIQKVTLTYKNLDGSLQERSIELNNAIDWHLPIFISQSMGEINNSTINSVKKEKNKKYIHLYTSKNIKFYTKDKELKIVTKDNMIRSFLLTDPHRIVLDFKKDVNLKSESKSFKNKVFKKIDIGTHNGYYRSVIVLDGQYKFRKEKKPYGYSVTLL